MLSRGQRGALAGGIAFAHLVGIWLLLGSGRFPLTVENVPPIEVSLLEIPSVAPLRPSSSKATQSGPIQETESERGRETEAPTVTPSAEGSSAIDWESEASAAADDAVRDLMKGETRHCDDSPKRNPLLPPCKRRPGRFEWSEEPKRAGFEGVLPYIRLGKHCILSVGMFGCAIGSPEANGHLFADMRDPDRDRSSVPDIGEINEPIDDAPQRPSVVLKPSRTPYLGPR